MHTKKLNFLKPLSGLSYYLPDSFNNPFELSVSFMCTVTAVYIITFTITHVPNYAIYGPHPGIIPGLCVT